MKRMITVKNFGIFLKRFACGSGKSKRMHHSVDARSTSVPQQEQLESPVFFLVDEHVVEADLPLELLPVSDSAISSPEKQFEVSEMNSLNASLVDTPNCDTTASGDQFSPTVEPCCKLACCESPLSNSSSMSTLSLPLPYPTSIVAPTTTCTQLALWRPICWSSVFSIRSAGHWVEDVKQTTDSHVTLAAESITTTCIQLALWRPLWLRSSVFSIRSAGHWVEEVKRTTDSHVTLAAESTLTTACTQLALWRPLWLQSSVFSIRSAGHWVEESRWMPSSHVTLACWVRSYMKNWYLEQLLACIIATLVEDSSEMT